VNLANILACFIIPMSRRVVCKRAEEKYTFIKFRNGRFPVTFMCKVLKVHRVAATTPGCKIPNVSVIRTTRICLATLNSFWLVSGGVYGYRKITKDIYEGVKVLVGTHASLNISMFY
jgi:hypothetical protein